MTDDKILSGLEQVINRAFKRTDIRVTPEMTAAQIPGWDSFRHISVIMGAEEHFGIRFLDSDIEGLHNVGAFVRAVALRISAET